MRPVVWLSLLSVAWVPSAEAAFVLNDSHVLFEDERTIQQWSNSTLSDPESKSLRESVDADGDSNGDVSAEEVESYKEQAKDGFLAVERTSPTRKVDGQGPSDVVFVVYEVDGLVGPADATTPVTSYAQTRSVFPMSTSVSHVLEIRANPSAQPTTGRLDVPSGYHLTDVQGLTNPEYANAERTVTGSVAPNTATRFTFTQGQGTDAPDEDGDDSPSPALLFVLAALVGSAAVLKRRRKA